VVRMLCGPDARYITGQTIHVNGGGFMPRMVQRREAPMTIRTLAPVLAAAIALAGSPAQAEMKHEWVEYSQGGTKLKAYLVYDDKVTGRRPAVLMIHAREGMTPKTQSLAEIWAKLGYVTFAADIFGYGEGVLPKDVPEMQAQIAIYDKDRALMRARTQAAFDVLVKNPMVDPSRIALIGYCFGGGVGIEFAGTGAPLVANVAIHGSFRDRAPGWAANAKGMFLILHGAEDVGFPLTTVDRLIQELRVAKVRFQYEVYSGNAQGAVRHLRSQGGADSRASTPFSVQLESRRVALRPVRRLGAVLAAVKIAPFGGNSNPFLSLGDIKLYIPSVTNRTTGKSMGEHTEITAKDWSIAREDQDRVALESHRRALAAWERGFFDDLVLPVGELHRDTIPREDTSLEKLGQLAPSFDRITGRGNADRGQFLASHGRRCQSLGRVARRPRKVAGEHAGGKADRLGDRIDRFPHRRSVDGASIRDPATPCAQRAHL
jgi:dienelactone hydrolase